MGYIYREHSMAPNSLAVTASASTTRAFVMGQAAGGVIYCTATGTAAAVTLNFYLDPDDSGTKYLLCDDTNTAIAVTVQPDRCTAIPDVLFGAGKVYPVTTSSTATLRIGLKT
jgi:hypothetical protein